MPISYYEQTTPYANFHDSKFKKYQLEDDLIKFEDDDDIIYPSDDDKLSQIKQDNYDDDDDFGIPGELVEAFNPNVQVNKLITKQT